MSPPRNQTKWRVKESSRDKVREVFLRIEMDAIEKSPEGASLAKLLGIDRGTIGSFQTEIGVTGRTYKALASKLKTFQPSFDLSEHVESFQTNSSQVPPQKPAQSLSSVPSTGQSEFESTLDSSHHDDLPNWFSNKWLISVAIVTVLVALGYISIRNRPSADRATDTQYTSQSPSTSDSTSSTEPPSRSLEDLPIRLTEQTLPYRWKQPEPEFDIDWDIRVGRGGEVSGLDEYEEPLISGDLLKIKLYSKLPVYFEVYWLDAEGAVFCIYPESQSQKNLSTTLELPPIPDQSFVLSGAEGLHAIVAVAFQADVSINAKLSPLPQPANLIPFEQGAAYFDESGMVDRGHRGPPIAVSKTAKMNDPVGVLSTLTKTKWDQRAAAVRAVCFVTMNRSERE